MELFKILHAYIGVLAECRTVSCQAVVGLIFSKIVLKCIADSITNLAAILIVLSHDNLQDPGGIYTQGAFHLHPGG